MQVRHRFFGLVVSGALDVQFRDLRFVIVGARSLHVEVLFVHFVHFVFNLSELLQIGLIEVG